MITNEKVDVRDEIMEWLETNERSMAWLAEKTGINYNTLYSILKQKVMKLSAARLELINNFLATKFKK
jgi:lambda repressor-like predicted transcriptional regulator